MSKFESAKSFVSWLGLVPQNNESGGKRKTTRISHAGAYIMPVLIQWANAVCRSKKYPEISNYYHKISQRRGHKKALIALCRKLMLAVYKMLSDITAYNPEKFSGVKSKAESGPSDMTLNEAIRLLSSRGFFITDEDGVVINSKFTEEIQQTDTQTKPEPVTDDTSQQIE